ncbi:hypothetical protein NE237_017162 [Protea cynaroides]|uniref:C2 domain-containing protein n=1 Tax=Protea cynaroides TaxID=273540 RepID=A0A9Q0K7I0_9MAGN|nr:hypothetical protein NE237_017162 [Protea cynaroides]
MSVAVITILKAKNLMKNEYCDTHGSLNPYVVVWADLESKYRTHVDRTGGNSPTWNARLDIPLAGRNHDSLIHIHVVDFNAGVGTNTLIGSCQLSVKETVDKVGFGVPTNHCLNLHHPSGHPQGKLKLNVVVYAAPPPQLVPYPSAPAYAQLPSYTAVPAYAAPPPPLVPYPSALAYGQLPSYTAVPAYAAPPPPLVPYLSSPAYGQPLSYSAAPAYAAPQPPPQCMASEAGPSYGPPPAEGKKKMSRKEMLMGLGVGARLFSAFQEGSDLDPLGF